MFSTLEDIIPPSLSPSASLGDNPEGLFKLLIKKISMNLKKIAALRSSKKSEEIPTFKGIEFSHEEGGILFQNVDELFTIRAVTNRKADCEHSEGMQWTLCALEGEEGKPFKAFVKHRKGSVLTTDSLIEAFIWAKPDEDSLGVSYRCLESE